MHINEQIINIIPKKIHVFIPDWDKIFTKIMLTMLKLDTNYGFMNYFLHNKSFLCISAKREQDDFTERLHCIESYDAD